MNNRPITREQEEYIKAHLNDRPRTQVARDAGVSLATVYRIVRENGGVLDYNRDRRNPEWERIVRENYATMGGHEIERRYGMTRNRANKIARELGLRHNAETEERIRRENALRTSRLDRSLFEDRRKRRWKLVRRIDELRVLSGLPQRTRFKMKSMTNGAYKAKWNLIKRRGYIESTDPYTLLCDGGTQRAPKCGNPRATEEYYARKYKLRFIEA